MSPSDEDASDEAVEEAADEATEPDDIGFESTLLPPGYSEVLHVTPSNRKYKTYVNDQGRHLRSKAAPSHTCPR